MLVYEGIRTKDKVYHLVLKDTDRDIEIGIPIEKPVALRIMKYLDTIMPPTVFSRPKEEPSE